MTVLSSRSCATSWAGRPTSCCRCCRSAVRCQGLGFRVNIVDVLGLTTTPGKDQKPCAQAAFHAVARLVFRVQVGVSGQKRTPPPSSRPTKWGARLRHRTTTQRSCTSTGSVICWSRGVADGVVGSFSARSGWRMQKVSDSRCLQR